MASQVTESVQTSIFSGAETMIITVPFRITNRSNASLRQPGKYTKATGGNGGWDGDVFPPIIFGAEVSVALRHFVYIRIHSYIQRAQLLCFRLQR